MVVDRIAMDLEFVKMHGAGNDFVVVATAPPGAPRDAVLVRALADRRRGVGADGVLFLEREADPPGVIMHFYNCDGGRAGLCLNGSRCVALRARKLGWVQGRFAIRTDHQTLQASVEAMGDADHGRVVLELDPPRAMARAVEIPPELAPDAAHRWATLLDTGDPHLVVEVDGSALEASGFEERARALRHWPEVGPEGANVHFVHRGEEEWEIRSYERGVEAETLACGSGCVSAVSAFEGAPLEVVRHLRTRSGDRLTIGTGATRWWLEGPAVQVFESVWRDDG